MASKGIEMCLGLVLLLMLWHRAEAQAGCTGAIVSMAPCISYVTGNTSTPSASCCSQLDTVVKSTPLCLCSLMNGAAAPFGISINRTLALRLPAACNVKTPPVSQCNAVANGPASTPTISPAPAPATSPSSPAEGTNESPSSTTAQTPAIPSGTGSKTVPSTNGSTSAGNLEKPFHLSTVIIFIAAFPSIVISF